MSRPNRFTSLLILALILLLSSTALADENSSAMTIDSERSQITWVSDAPMERIVGTASEIQGEINWNLENLEATSGRIYFPVESMRTGNRTRDRHLQGRDWLNARENANVIFEIERLEDVQRERNGDQIVVEATVIGHVVVNGERAENRATVSLAILPDQKRVRIAPTIQIRLADHNVEGQRGRIGSEVGETIDIEGVLYGSWQ